MPYAFCGKVKGLCGAYNPDWANPDDDNSMEIHLWKDCPCLTKCKQCDMVIEAWEFNQHLLVQCDQSQTFRYEPPLGTEGFASCPLCFDAVPANETEWKQHLCYECPANPRIQGGGA